MDLLISFMPLSPSFGSPIVSAMLSHADLTLFAGTKSPSTESSQAGLNYLRKLTGLIRAWGGCISTQEIRIGHR